MFHVSENKITAGVGAVIHQYENFSFFFSFLSLFLDPMKLT